MSYRLIAQFVACAALLTASILPAAAQIPMPEKTASIDISNADLHEVVTMLEHQANVQMTVHGNNTSFQPVTVHLDDAPLSKIVQTIALSAGAKVTQNADGSCIFTPIPGRMPSTSTAANNVNLQIELVETNRADIDRLGISFDRIPLLPDSMQSASGDSVPQLYQKLTRTHGHMLDAQSLTTESNTPVRFSIDTTVPKAILLDTRKLFFHAQGLRGEMTLTPRLNPDHSITLEIRKVGVSPNNLVALRTMAIDDMLVVISQIPSADNASFFGSLIQTVGKQPEGQMLCLFITATIVDANIIGAN